MVRLFERRAGWFVGAGWLLFVSATSMAALQSIGPFVMLGYHPDSANAPFYRSVIHVANAAMVVSIAAAALPSIVLALKFRVTASALVVGCWSVIIAWYVVLQSLGLSSVMRLTGLGPQQIERYIGSQKFDVPGQYRPGNIEAVNLPGFSFWACGNLLGSREQRCGAFTQVVVSPAEMGLERQYDVNFWRDRLPEMKGGEIRSEHKEYIYTSAADAPGQATTIRYFVRLTPEGQVSRLVACPDFGNCRHHARVANYVLTYEAPESKFAEWDTMDWQLTALIDSWRK